MGRGHDPGTDGNLSAPGHARGGLSFPDWTGESVAIIASGPSAKKADFSHLSGHKVIAVKECVDLYPSADVVYGCDAPWWKHRRGLPEFRGLKVTWSGNGLDYPDLLKIDIARNPKGHPDTYVAGLVLEPVGTIGGGGNSGFQALNLAVQWGARKVILIGFDMTDRSGKHWYGRNHWPMASNPDQSNFRRWIAAFESAAPVLKSLGVEVLNASRDSALACFPRRDLKDCV